MHSYLYYLFITQLSNRVKFLKGEIFLNKNSKIKIGIPRAMLYYKHKVMWSTFFEELGCEIVLSPKTNKLIMNEGINNSIDESCLSSKIFVGHVKHLIEQPDIDYIFIPRIASYGKDDKTCTKFFSLPDIISNTFPECKNKLIDFNIDILNGKTEKKAFLNLGLYFTKNLIKINSAYQKAVVKQLQYNEEKHNNQDELINNSSKNKILIVSHPYNIYDDYIGQPIVDYLKKLDCDIIYSDRVDSQISKNLYSNISNTLYWSYNKELVGGLEYLKGKIDGIIYLVTFPCRPDSLVVEFCQRTISGIPSLNIILDEQQGVAGQHTRLESFIDVINMRKSESI